MPRHFTEEQLKKLDPKKVPDHVAIIMDGNRRWAKKRGFIRSIGHSEGVKTLFTIVSAASEIGIKTLTVFGFSTENWSRAKAEISVIMRLCEKTLKNRCQNLVDQGVKLQTIGDLSKLPLGLQKQITLTQKATIEGEKITLVLALNYGARDEIRRAVQRICLDFSTEKFKKEQITEKMIGSYLDTAFLKDPDLFIRTSGEMRFSNFLLWQLAYTEVYLPKVLWPDFSPDELLKGVLAYQNRKRRYGS